MPNIKTNREFRAMNHFELVQNDDPKKEQMIVRGTAVVFDTPTCIYECDGIKYYEIIDRGAFGGCDMSDVIFKYNHGGKTVARLRNKTLRLDISGEGLLIEADLSGTTAGKELYEEIRGGYVDKMSFAFSVAEETYSNETRTRTITKIKKLYDVSAVDIPAYNETSITARNFFEGERAKEVLALEQASRRQLLIAKTRLLNL